MTDETATEPAPTTAEPSAGAPTVEPAADGFTGTGTGTGTGSDTAAPRFDIALPGVWSYIPLQSREAANAAVARLVEQTVGRRDEDARLRADIRASFSAAVTQARSAGAAQLHLCHELVSGVPLPASLTVYWPRLSLKALRELDPLTALRRVLGPGESGDSDAVVAPTRGGPGLRRMRLVTGRPPQPQSQSHSRPSATTASPTTTELPEITTVEVDYWLVTPTGQVLLLSFACGMPALADQLVGLFDLIVASLRWR